MSLPGGCGGLRATGDGDSGAPTSDAAPDVVNDIPPDAPPGPAGPLPCVAPKVKCGAACVDLDVDGQNCGACGRSCLGGACASRTCAAGVLSTRMDVLPRTLVATDTDLFFLTSAKQVIQLPIGGGPAITLATQDVCWNIAVAAPKVVFAGQQQLWTATIGTAAGAAPVELSTKPNFYDSYCANVVAAGGSITALTAGEDSNAIRHYAVTTCPQAGGACVMRFHAYGAGAGRMAAGSGFVFWTDNTSVYEMPDTGGAVTTLSVESGPATAAFWDGATLYWYNDPDVRRSPFPAPNASTFRTIPRLSDLIVDATNLYYVDNYGLSVLPKNAPPATAPIHITTSGGFLTQNATAIFWVGTSGIEVYVKP